MKQILNPVFLIRNMKKLKHRGEYVVSLCLLSRGLCGGVAIGVANFYLTRTPRQQATSIPIGLV